MTGSTIEDSITDSASSNSDGLSASLWNAFETSPEDLFISSILGSTDYFNYGLCCKGLSPRGANCWMNTLISWPPKKTLMICFYQQMEHIYFDGVGLLSYEGIDCLVWYAVNSSTQ